MAMIIDPEAQACIPVPVDHNLFHQSCILPYDLTPDHLYQAMVDFIDFLGFIIISSMRRNTPALKAS